MSKVSKSFFLFFLFIALLVSFSCNKDDLKWDLPRTNPLDSAQTSGVPSLSTLVASSVSQHTATSGGASINDNGSPITEKGVCWSTNSNPTVSDSHTSDGTGTSDFSSQLTGLNSNTQYYVRAYATNSEGTGYGLNEVLTTTTNPIATITTSSVTNIAQQSANCGGTIISNGGAAISASGICWSTAINPTVSDAHTSNGSSSGSFTSQLTNLNPSTTYYVRAYATTAYGTGYGQNIQFTTLSAPVATLTTASVTNISQNSATSGGTIVSNGGTAITASGICWSTAINPTVSDAHTSNGSSSGSFTSQLTNLNPSTTYYVRAYATTAYGTGYGQNIQFTTLSAPVATLTTASVTNISQNSATSGGTIVSNGGAAITASGICWSTASNPTINNTHTSNTVSSGSFQSQLTNLNPSTTYYVRAYATTSAGTGYGQTVTFTTSNIPTPTAVGTQSCSNLSSVNSLYYGMNGTNAVWGISPSGYSGSCWVAPNPNNSGQLGTAVGSASTPHYTQFTRTFNNSGYMEMWINTPNGNGYNNVIPTIYVDGIALSSTTIGGQSSAFYWLQLRTSAITAGTHTIKIQFVGSYYTFKVDEITFFEYQ